MANGKVWTTKENELLREFASEYKTANEAAAALGRTRNGVLRQAHKLKIKFKRLKDWSKEEEAELIQLYKDGVYVEAIAERLNRNPSAIITKASRLGIGDRINKRRIIFTKEDIAEMKEMYKNDEPLRKIAEDYGVCASTVMRIMKEGGLKPRAEMGVRATRKDKYIIPFKRLTKLYLNDCLSEERISEIEGVSRNRVRGSLRYHGIAFKNVYQRRKERESFLKKGVRL